MNVFEIRTKIEQRRGEVIRMMVNPGLKTFEDYQRALTQVRTLDEVLEMTRERGNEVTKDKSAA